MKDKSIGVFYHTPMDLMSKYFLDGYRTAADDRQAFLLNDGALHQNGMIHHSLKPVYVIGMRGFVMFFEYLLSPSD